MNFTSAYECWKRKVFKFLLQPFGGGMFGRSLAETVKFETRRGGGYVPLIVHKCVDFIRAHGKSFRFCY